MTRLTTVELFAGIGGFRIASDSHGFETVWANDNCPKACAVYRSCFGDRELREGNINTMLDEVPSHDLLTAGFPCQPFSSAGKKKGIKDPRGTLFQTIVTLLKRHQPRFFILENVKRLLSMENGSHFATILSVLAELDYWIEWRLLNAMHFGLPQNRQRVVLLGVHIGELSLNDVGSNDLAPIKLASLDDLADLSGRQFNNLSHPGSWKPIVDHDRRLPDWGLAYRGRFFATDLKNFSERLPLVPLRSVLESNVSREFDFTESTLQRMRNSKPVHRYVQGVEILSNQGGGARMGYTVFGIDGVAPTLTATPSRHYERYKIGDRYRRLTNVEYARIQGFPDNHCKIICVYDQYGLLGNAVPPPMVKWVMDRMLARGVIPESPGDMQLEMFTYAT